MIEYLDEGNKGYITKQAFLKFMTARLVSPIDIQDYRDDPEALRTAFDYFDQRGQGSIRLLDIEKIAEELGEEVAECVRIMEEADKDEDGNLNE